MTTAVANMVQFKRGLDGRDRQSGGLRDSGHKGSTPATAILGEQELKVDGIGVHGEGRLVEQLVDLGLHGVPVVRMMAKHRTIHAHSHRWPLDASQDGGNGSGHQISRSFGNGRADQMQCKTVLTRGPFNAHQTEYGLSVGQTGLVHGIKLHGGYVRGHERVGRTECATLMVGEEQRLAHQVHHDGAHQFAHVHARHHLLVQLLARIDGIDVDRLVPACAHKVETLVVAAQCAHLSVVDHGMTEGSVRLEVAQIDAST